MRHKKFKLIALFLLGFGLMGLQAQTFGTFTDSRDGKVYKTVKIGEQVWMAENLAFKPASGNYWAADNKADNIAVYGYLYDWVTANEVCPAGWHLPSDAEWTKLTDYLGGHGVGKKLTETGTTHWVRTNKKATNETGFTALPGGYRLLSGGFSGSGRIGYWWSSTEYSTDTAWYRELGYDYSRIYRGSLSEEYGFSVRCVRD